MEILLILQTVASPHGCSHSVDDRRNGENIDERDDDGNNFHEDDEDGDGEDGDDSDSEGNGDAILTKKGRPMRKPSKAIVDDSCIVDSDLQEAN